MLGFSIIYAAFLVQIFALACFFHLCRFPNRTFSDVIPYLRPDHQGEVEDLLNPIKEENLLLALRSKDFRVEQLKRIHLAREILIQRAHNARIFQEWADTETERAIKSLDPEGRTIAKALIDICLDYRLNSCMILGKLYAWHIRLALLPFTGFPRLSHLGKNNSFDLIKSYANVEQAAEKLALACGDEYRYRLAQTFTARQSAADAPWMNGETALSGRF